MGNSKLKILFVAGTRPNFMKVAPLLRECKKYPEIETILLHTGQHYDKEMSEVFFQQLGIQKPDITLHSGEVSDPVEQKNYIGNEIYKAFKDSALDCVVVVGDVNSTVGGAIGGERLNVPVAHVEAGLRSFDERMPEEHNRIAVDKIAKYLFVTEPLGLRNLKRERLIQGKKVFLVGNVMIDSLIFSWSVIKNTNTSGKMGLSKKEYVVITLHRKENLEDPEVFDKLFAMILEISHQRKVVWTLHPRTRKYLIERNLLETVQLNSNIVLLEPLGYFEILSLLSDSLCAITDSGGIQDETTFLGVPCLTIRRTTERPVTITVGTSSLVGENQKRLLRLFSRITKGKYKKSKIPSKWDGKSSERIVKILKHELSSSK